MLYNHTIQMEIEVFTRGLVSKQKNSYAISETGRLRTMQENVLYRPRPRLVRVEADAFVGSKQQRITLGGKIIPVTELTGSMPSKEALYYLLLHRGGSEKPVYVLNRTCAFQRELVLVRSVDFLDWVFMDFSAGAGLFIEQAIIVRCKQPSRQIIFRYSGKDDVWVTQDIAC